MPDLLAGFTTATGQQAALGGAAAFLLLLAGMAALRRLKPWHSYLRGKSILTPNELEFYRRLTRALPHHPIFTQVALSAFIAVDRQLSDRQQFAIRRRFGWKYCDFLLCEPYTLNILCVIELDDSTHTASADRKRDAMLRAAGYQTLRFQSKHKPTAAELAEHFAKVLPTLKR